MLCLRALMCSWRLLMAYVGQLCSVWLNAQTHLHEHGVTLTCACPLQDCYKRCNLAVPS